MTHSEYLDDLVQRIEDKDHVLGFELRHAVHRLREERDLARAAFGDALRRYAWTDEQRSNRELVERSKRAFDG